MKFGKKYTFIIVTAVWCITYSATYGQQTLEDLEKIFANECEEGQRADNYSSWSNIKSNAARTADQYAVEHNPNAVFINPNIGIHYQVAGEHQGKYLVSLTSETKQVTNFAMLKPNFDFCADPQELDDSRSDLFTVILAKFNGKEF